MRLGLVIGALATAAVLAARAEAGVTALAPIPNAVNCDDYHYDPAGQYLNSAALNQIAGLLSSGLEVAYDGNGVPLVKYGARFFYNPVVNAQVGLEAISRYAIAPNPADLAAAVKLADWFVRSQTKAGKWLYRFPVKIGQNRARLPVPWASAMAQGQAISLLTRVYRVTHRPKYLRASKRALRPLTVPVAKGGLVASLFGHPFYEEAPTRPPSFILNGFMFTLLGLHDLETLANRSRAPKLFDVGLRTLQFGLPFYDVGDGRSLYDLIHLTDPPQPLHRATPGYQKVHVLELCALDSIRANPVFEFYRDLWRTAIPRQ
jgi:heparosan-N-sulfate-glucuronate 5-epimerase